MCARALCRKEKMRFFCVFCEGTQNENVRCTGYVWTSVPPVSLFDTYPGGSGIPDTDVKLFPCPSVYGAHHTQKTDRQLMIYVSAQNSNYCLTSPSTTLAYAGYCILDDYYRPVASHINICPQAVQILSNENITDEEWDDFASIFLHETRS